MTWRVAPLFPWPRRARFVFERNVMVYRRTWLIIFSGFFEPMLYLLGIGFGLGSLVGGVHTGVGGQTLGYAAFVAPALMASSAMNGAIFDSTFNLFFKLKFGRIYDGMLVTPIAPIDVAVGEIGWALFRGTLYAVAFVVVMGGLGLVHSAWIVLAIPSAVLIGFCFAALGTSATTYVRTWEDFDLIQVFLLPMFLFSGSFFPITAYPAALRVVVQLTPLYHGVHLIRGLSTGLVGPGLLLDAGYLAVLGVLGIAFTSRRLSALLLR
ncbi:MAG: ABC transporter permease [Candidatus Dormibacteria bacterium]